MKRIGFIGTGVMGSAMAANLMKSGYEVFVFNRSREKAQSLIDAGAVWCDSVRDCSRGKDAVITIIGYPKDVEEVWLGSEGILNCADRGTYVIDMTTTSPRLSASIYEKALEKGLFALDAPVSGGDKGAKSATLSIMVGGDKVAYNACLPVFQAMGTTIVYEGKAGSGQHTKMANQIAIAGTVTGVAEAVAYSQSHGLNPGTMLESISKGAAGSFQMTSNAPKMIDGDFAPGFFIKHFIKDMQIAADEAVNVGLQLPVLQCVLKLYKELEENGCADEGTQAIIKKYTK